MTDLNRFVQAQPPPFHKALTELRNGLKTSHWMWFIFPQLKALSKSKSALFYGIEDLVEAEAYLQNDLLRTRLLLCTDIVLHLQGKQAEDIFGKADAIKLKSSMTLFNYVLPTGNSCERVLNKYFNGATDNLTLNILIVERRI